MGSRKIKRYLLRILCWVPDKVMLKMQYILKVGRKLNLSCPKRYTEKIQWYKLYYKNPILPSCVDKYDVREYVKNQGLEEILVDIYGIYNNYSEVDWDVLPEKFVVKDTLGGGNLAVIIVSDKSKLDYTRVERSLRAWTNSNCKIKTDGREWPYYYYGKKHRILVEKLIESDNGLVDYKFFCFYGKVFCIYLIENRKIGGHGSLAIMDEEFRRIPYQSATQAVTEEDPQKPENFERMKVIARKLSSAFPHVRVDLYNVKGKIYFGELTFYGASGYQRFVPDEFDFILGNQFILPTK